MLLIYGALILVGQQLTEWVAEALDMDIAGPAEVSVQRIVLITALLYLVLMAIPFVPGIEVGLGLMALLGSKVCLLVYGSTVAALALTFLLGRLVPPRAIAGLFDRLGLTRARDLVRQLAPLGAEQRLSLLFSQAPTRIAPRLLRHRYIALAVALNLPGNALIGGGGGIALAAGISGLFTLPRYLALIMLAVAPVPAMIALQGG